MTIKEMTILKQNGEEVTFTFTDSGVLKKQLNMDSKEINPKETIYLHKDPKRYVEFIINALQRENINNAIAITGIFVDEDGSLIEQEGLLGNMFYTNKIKEADIESISTGGENNEELEKDKSQGE